MNTRLNQKVVRGELVEVIESSGGFLGGIEYQLVVGGKIKEQSKGLSYILSAFDRYWLFIRKSIDEEKVIFLIYNFTVMYYAFRL